MYGNDIFAEMIALQWFHRGGEGRLFSSQFKPVPLPLLALVATSVCPFILFHIPILIALLPTRLHLGLSNMVAR